MERIIKLDGIVTGFSITEKYIDCICQKALLKLDNHSGEVILSKEIFEKEGFARNLIADNRSIFIYDFCMLYIFNQKDYELVGRWQLGKDLTSDICGIYADNNTVYCSMRNGRIITVDRQSHERREHNITDSSMWSLKEYGNYLVAGTVNGQLLLVNKATFAIEKRISLGAQNIRSFWIDNQTLYAAGQDKKIYKINLSTFEIDGIKRNAHKKMFDCIGLYENLLITVSYPCSEIILWDKKTLEKKREINIPLKLSGYTHLEKNHLYISSRNIQGIKVFDLL